MKNIIESIRSRVKHMEERVKWPGVQEYRNNAERELILKKSKESQWELSDSIKEANIWIIGVPEGKKRKKGTENLLKEIKAENFPNMENDLDTQVHEANILSSQCRKTFYRTHSNETRISMIKKESWGSQGKKEVPYKGTPLGCQVSQQNSISQERAEW